MRDVARSLSDYVSCGLRWWGGELKALVPVRLRRMLDDIDGRLVLTAPGAAPLELIYEAGGRRELLARFAASATVPSEAAGLRGIVRTWRRRAAHISIRLTPDRALRTVASLPLAAEKNLSEVLSFELDRQTPFKSSEAYFAHRRIARDPAAKRLSVELTVVPRTVVDELRQIAERIDLKADSVEVEAGPRGPHDLLQGQRLSRPQKATRAVFAGLGIAAVLLATAALLVPLQRAHETAASLAQQLAVAKQQADAATRLQRQIEAQIQDGHALLTRKQQTATDSAVLYFLTDALGDDTWLTDMQLSGTDVQMTGSAASASDLIARLDQSRHFSNAAFRSPVTQDTKTNREQFSIAATLMPEARR
jgi:general secretion pathway protein L